MKIAVYGSATGTMLEHALDVARKTGELIAVRGHTLITGACKGVPQAAVEGAAGKGGHVIGYPSYYDLNAQTAAGNPTQGFTEFVFIPPVFAAASDVRVAHKYRNLCSVAACDACIIVSGQYGTLNEFTIAYDLCKPIGVVTGTGGFADLLKDMTAKVVKDPHPFITFSDDPEVVLNDLERHLSAQA